MSPRIKVVPAPPPAAPPFAAEVSYDAMRALLTALLPVVGARGVMDSARCFLLTMRDGTLSVAATNTLGTAWGEVAATGANGALIVNAAAFFAAITALGGDVKLAVKPATDGRLPTLAVSAGRRKHELPTLDAALFPTLPSMASVVWTTLPLAALEVVVGSVRHAMTTVATRPHMLCIQLEAEGATLCGVATDGHGLAVCRAREALDAAAAAVLPMLLPSAFVKLAADLMQGRAEPTIALGRSPTHVWVRLGPDVRAHLQSAEVAFPDWRGAMPPESTFTTHATVRRETLIESAAACQSVAAANNGEVVADISVRLDVDAAAGVLALSRTSTEHQFNDTIDAHGVAGPTPAVGVSPRLLIAALKAGRGEETFLKFGGMYDPIAICTGPDHVEIMMPIRHT